MRILTFLTNLCLVSTATFAQGWVNPYESTRLAKDQLEVRFYRWGDAILIDNVMVNGKGPFRFVLDTGAEGAGRLDTTLVERLNLSSIGSDTGVGILGQKQVMNRHRLESLSIGDLTFAGVEMISGDYNADRPSRVKPIDGILGYHLFKDYLLTISYPQRTITIARGELPLADGVEVLRVVSDDEDPEVEVRIGERTVKALIDTGAMSFLAVPESLASEFKFTGESSKKQGPIRTATLDGALRIGEVEFQNPQAIIATGLQQPNIGIRILASLAVTFDQRNDRIRMVRAPEPLKFGVKFSMRDSGPWRFDGVVAEGPAARAGLRDTDRIVAIGGHVFAEMDREDLDRVLIESPLVFEIERDGAPMEILITPE